MTVFALVSIESRDFTGFDGSELGTEEKEEKGDACDGIGKALESEGKEFLTQG